MDAGEFSFAVSVTITETNSSLNFVVQDRPEITESAKKESVPALLKGRMNIMAHDFLSIKPITADF